MSSHGPPPPPPVCGTVICRYDSHWKLKMLLHCFSGSRKVHQHLPLKPFTSPWDSNLHGWDSNPLAPAWLRLTCPGCPSQGQPLLPGMLTPFRYSHRCRWEMGLYIQKRPGICIKWPRHTLRHTHAYAHPHTEACQTHTCVHTLTCTLVQVPSKSRLRSQAALLDCEVPSFPLLL